MGSKKSSSTTNTNQTTKSDVSQYGYESSTRTPFTSASSIKNYNDFVGAAGNNYGDLTDLTNSLYQTYNSGQGIGDTSYFKQAWGQAQGIDQNNMKKLNSQSYNPNDNEDWVKANDDIDANQWRKYGKVKNQVDQNAIGSNMGGSTGHQSAAYNAAANYASQVAADRANRWQSQYNQNIQNMMAANNQLGNFYNTLSNIGIDYAKLSQQDLSTLLSAYNAQNDALKTWGSAVEMGSDPTVSTSTQQRQVGTSNTQGTTSTNSKTSEGFGSIFGTVLGVMPWNKLF